MLSIAIRSHRGVVPSWKSSCRHWFHCTLTSQTSSPPAVFRKLAVTMPFPMLVAGLFWCVATCTGSLTAAEPSVDFSRQIRPILAKQCFACHGPETQQSGVALHELDKAIQDGESGLKPIVPGKWTESEIINRITSDDPSVRMPPEGAGVSETQVQLLKQWIDSGAEYKEHWAFLPLSDPKPPKSLSGANPTNPIISKGT